VDDDLENLLEELEARHQSLMTDPDVAEAHKIHLARTIEGLRALIAREPPVVDPES
jgi:hypothetical protein